MAKHTVKAEVGGIRGYLNSTLSNFLPLSCFSSAHTFLLYTYIQDPSAVYWYTLKVYMQAYILAISGMLQSV